MTYIVVKPPSTTAAALADANTIVIAQSGVNKTVVLSVFKAYLMGTTATVASATPAVSTPITLASATYDTSGMKFGAASLNGGTGNIPYANVPQAQPFTVECWGKTSAAGSSIQALFGGGSYGWVGVATDGTVTGQAGSGAPLTTTVHVADGVWHHFALVVASGNVTIWVDGKMAGTAAATGWAVPTAGAFGVRQFDTAGGATVFAGEIDELILSSVAKYTATFTPPAAAATGLETGSYAVYHLDNSGSGLGPAAGVTTTTTTTGSGSGSGSGTGTGTSGGSTGTPAAPLATLPVGLGTYPEGTSGPYGGIGDTGSGAGPQAYLYGRSLGDLFGTFTYPNPGAGAQDNGHTLAQSMAFLTTDMGLTPKTMNAFNNAGYGNAPAQVGGGTYAYGWNGDTASISGPNGYMRPIIGFKLNGQHLSWANPATYDDIANGGYDDQFRAEIQTWIGFGYKYLVYRVAYEMNGTFMPDYIGHTAADNARFAAAMRHVILLLKNEGAKAGVTVKATFNPSYMNNGDTDVMSAWPGDDVIDIVDTDQYNPCYNQTLKNYNADGTPDGTTAPDQATWLANANNRKKFWNYPGINYSDDYSYGSWSTLRAISIAKAKGKAISFSECGTGGGTDTNAYVANDATWVRWFWGMCQAAISQGVPIAHINFWNIYAEDGQWWYSVIGQDPQPLVKAAYRKYFGDGTFTGGPTPAANTGSTGIAAGAGAITATAGSAVPLMGPALPAGQYLNCVGSRATAAAPAAAFPGSSSFSVAAKIRPVRLAELNFGSPPYQAITALWQDSPGGVTTQCFYLGIDTTGHLIMLCSRLSDAAVWGTASTVTLPASCTSSPLWVRGTTNPTTGAQLYETSPDGTTWTRLGTTVSNTTFGPTPTSGTSPICVGNTLDGTDAFHGQVYRTTLTVGGTVVMDVNFETATPGTGSVTDANGNVFNIPMPGVNILKLTTATSGGIGSTATTSTPPATTNPSGSNTPLTNLNGGTLPTSGTGTPSPSGSTLASATGSLVDAAGITWTLYAISGGFRPVLGGVGDARTDSNPTQSLLYYNGLMYAYGADGKFYYFSFGQYTANPSDPRTTSGATPASVKVTDINGVSATLVLSSSPPMNFYGSDTGLLANIYYYADGSGNLTLDSSADGQIGSAIVTRNGSSVVSLMPGTSYV